jgi:hypothetical protein
VPLIAAGGLREKTALRRRRAAGTADEEGAVAAAAAALEASMHGLGGGVAYEVSDGVE